MEFLYGELPRPQRREFEQHLNLCEPCAQQRTEFGRTMTQLDRDKTNGNSHAAAVIEIPTFVKWAAAAALMVTTGFTTARLATPQLRPEVIEAQIAAPLRERLARELDDKIQHEAELTAERLQAIADKAAADAALTQEQFAVALSRLKERDAALYSAFKQVQSTWQTQHQTLREDLEKVALFTDRSVRSTERQLVQLSSLNQDPALFDESPIE